MVLFIPGVYSGPINYLFNTYFKPQYDYLNKNKINFQLSKASSEQLISINARCLRDQILQATDQITIITHSKGGIDLLETLRLYPEVKTKIRRIVCLQAPFYGSPVADLLTDKWWGKLFCYFSLFILRGHHRCLHEIRTDVRSEYMQSFDAMECFRGIDTTLVGAHKEKEVGKIFDTCLFPFRNWMSKKGLKSDGLVPLESTQIATIQGKYFENLDHASAVVVRTPLKFDTESFNHFLFSHLIN